MMKPIPCGGCGRAKAGEPFVIGRDCAFCHLALNHPAYRAWHPDPAVRASAPPSIGRCAPAAVSAALNSMIYAGYLGTVKKARRNKILRVVLCKHLGERKEHRAGCNSGFACLHECKHEKVSIELPQVVPADECQECEFYEPGDKSFGRLPGA